IDSPTLQQPDDPFSRRGGAGSLGTSGNFAIVIMAHACERFSQCGNTDRVLKAACDSYAKLLHRAAPPTRDAAQRSIGHIDSLDCDAGMTDAASLSRVMTQFADCTEALSC